MAQKARATPPFLTGGGELGALIRAYDWSKSPLGPAESWPSTLKTAVGLMLGARQPVYIAYGPELTSLYNDGYLPIVGTKHPHGLGKPFAHLWSEIWDTFRPIVEATMAGEAQHFVNLPIALGGRRGLPVGYFTFSYTRSEMKTAPPSVSIARPPKRQIKSLQKNAGPPMESISSSCCSRCRALWPCSQVQSIDMNM